MGSGKKTKRNRRIARAAARSRKTSAQAERQPKAAQAKPTRRRVQRPSLALLAGAAFILVIGVVALAVLRSNHLSVPVDIEVRALGSPAFFEAFQNDGTGEAQMSFVAEGMAVEPIPGGATIEMHLPVHPRRCQWLAAQLKTQCEDGVVVLPRNVNVNADSPMDITSESQQFQNLNLSRIDLFPPSVSTTPTPAGTTASNLSLFHVGVDAGVNRAGNLGGSTP